MAGFDGTYITVAFVDSLDTKQAVQTRELPTEQELELLFLLCRRLNKLTSLDGICNQLGSTINAVRVLATKLRKKLHDDWVIETKPNKGMRIIYAGGIEGTVRLEINETALQRTRTPSLESRKKNSESHLRRHELLRM